MNKTPEDVARYNEKTSMNNLRLLIMSNFIRDDVRLDLTYQGIAPESKVAKENLKKFLRNLRDLYKKNDTKLKYIVVTEYKRHRIHHHLLINEAKGIGARELHQAWKHGRIHCTPYDGHSSDAKAVAKYFIKETKNTFRSEDRIQGLRWNASKNLARPIINKVVVQANTFKKPVAPKGYYIEEYREGTNNEGYKYQFYRMVQTEDEKIQNRKRIGVRNTKNKKKKEGVSSQAERKQKGNLHEKIEKIRLP